MKTIMILILSSYTFSCMAYDCDEQINYFNNVHAQFKQQKEYEQQVLRHTTNVTEEIAQWVEAQVNLDAKKSKGIQIHNFAGQLNDARLKMNYNNDVISNNLVSATNAIYACLSNLLYQARMQNPSIN